jgi:hypothetical protein
MQHRRTAAGIRLNGVQYLASCATGVQAHNTSAVSLARSQCSRQDALLDRERFPVRLRSVQSNFANICCLRYKRAQDVNLSVALCDYLRMKAKRDTYPRRVAY